jgi:hypothetical protein
MKILVLLFAFALIFSCSNNTKINDPKVLGKKIFELLKKGDKESIESYFITKPDIEIVFEKIDFYVKLTSKEKSDFVATLYERQEKDFNMFLNMYIDDEDMKEHKALIAGVYNNTNTNEIQENVIKITKLNNYFTYDNSTFYNLILKSIKVNNLYKLLSWIEVRPMN